MIIDRKRLVRFLLVFGLLYTVCVLPWPGLRDDAANAFRSIGNTLFGGLRGDGNVVFSAPVDGRAAFDSRITLFDRSKRLYRDVPYDAHIYAYLPIALLTCLCLASPLPWRRRLTILAIGLGILAAFLWLRILLLLLRELTRGDGLGTWRPTRSQWWIIEILSGLAAKAPVPNFTLPVLIWAFLMHAVGGVRIRLGNRHG